MNVAIAFIAGLLSFFSPCVFPIIPSYILFLAGSTVSEFSGLSDKTAARRIIVMNSLLFILGFSLVFIVMGAAAGYFGQLLFGIKEIFRIVGGVLLVVFGLFISGILRLDFLNIEKKIEFGKPVSRLGVFVVGLTFAAAWTPCVGPILGSILVLAGSSSTLFMGILLLVCYSLGLALPFFLTALLIDLALLFFKRIQKYLVTIRFLSGIFIVLIGLLMIFDYYKAISSFLTL